MSPHDHPAVLAFEADSHCTLGPAAAAALAAAAGRLRGGHGGFAAAPGAGGDGRSLSGALPPDFWPKVGEFGGPLLRYLLGVLFAQVPVAALEARAASLTAALPAGVWEAVQAVLGPVVLDLLQQWLEHVPNPAAPAAGAPA